MDGDAASKGLHSDIVVLLAEHHVERVEGHVVRQKLVRQARDFQQCLQLHNAAQVRGLEAIQGVADVGTQH